MVIASDVRSGFQSGDSRVHSSRLGLVLSHAFFLNYLFFTSNTIGVDLGQA